MNEDTDDLWWLGLLREACLGVPDKTAEAASRAFARQPHTEAAAGARALGVYANDQGRRPLVGRNKGTRYVRNLCRDAVYCILTQIPYVPRQWAPALTRFKVFYYVEPTLIFIWTFYDTTQTRNGSHQNTPLSPTVGMVVGAEINGSRPTFKPVTVLEDLQAVRCAEFHPNGKLYAVGSNTKTLRICTYPKIDDVKENSAPTAPTVLLKRTKHHKGSIYCLAWSPAGDLLATGSNDKTVKLMRFNSHACNLEGQEVELTMHDGTVRDVCFIEDTSNKTSLLVSGGAGDCKIYVTDCATGKTFQALSGHSGHVLSLYTWGGAMFVSGSQDKSVRFWDLRTGGCVNIISPPNGHPNKGSAVASLAVDPSGRLLVCGHDDGSCALHDVRGSRALQRFTPHSGDVRSVRFSPGAYYLLTAGYDGRVVLTDLQGDLTCTLPSVPVARHPDKVISARWHPDDFSFLSTSADKTAVLWTIPPV
ncbi:unnamed protein product [Parnassius apollo]|uniref:(apollo) hypothetical protein n=1 Tax=Parnassius apollo TaxID=110799 RepID=A0A8S3XSP6_PARAO|nr:unnamed protein product [Parnassius apollo]